MKAAIYTRVSLAKMGDTTKTDEQERLCRELCQRRGWEPVVVCTDLSRSAWKRDRKRPGWDALIAAVKAGEVSVIVSYWGDRLVRQPRDLEDLLDLRDTREITVASVAGQYDFANPEHRMMMRWEVARACNESDTISRRMTAAHERRRRQGLVRPGGRGGRAFGFEKDNLTPVPAECDVVREAAARVLAGEGAGPVCASLTARGIVTTTGNPFSHGTLRRMLARPRYAGLMPDGQSPAAWEPVISRADWEVLCAVLDGRAARFPAATNGRRHLLSGIALCGACGRPLAIRQSKGRAGQRHLAGYGCVTPGCRKVYRDKGMLDEYVTGAVLTRLASPGNPPGRGGPPGRGAEYAALTAALAEIDEMIADPSRGRLAALLARRDAAERRLAELREATAAGDAAWLRARHQGLARDGWDEMPLAQRRALVRACYQVTVLPASKRGPGFQPQDVVLSPRQGTRA